MIRASLLSAALLALLVPSTASAGLMLTASDIIKTSTPPSSNRNPSSSDIEAYLDGALHKLTLASESAYGAAALGSLLFKWEVGEGEESGPSLTSSYDVENLVNDGKDAATLRYVAGKIVDTTQPAFLVVKGGDAGFVVYDLDKVGSYQQGPTDVWNGTDPLTFTNAGLIKEKVSKDGIVSYIQQDISNIQVWGGSKQPPTGGPPVGANGVVPEPTTLAIWSVLGIGGLVSRRRNRSKRS